MDDTERFAKNLFQTAMVVATSRHITCLLLALSLSITVVYLLRCFKIKFLVKQFLTTSYGFYLRQLKILFRVVASPLHFRDRRCLNPQNVLNMKRSIFLRLFVAVRDYSYFSSLFALLVLFAILAIIRYSLFGFCRHPSEDTLDWLIDNNSPQCVEWLHRTA